MGGGLPLSPWPPPLAYPCPLSQHPVACPRRCRGTTASPEVPSYPWPSPTFCPDKSPPQPVPTSSLPLLSRGPLPVHPCPSVTLWGPLRGPGHLPHRRPRTEMGPSGWDMGLWAASVCGPMGRVGTRSVRGREGGCGCGVCRGCEARACGCVGIWGRGVGGMWADDR